VWRGGQHGGGDGSREFRGGLKRKQRKNKLLRRVPRDYTGGRGILLPKGRGTIKRKVLDRNRDRP